MLLIEKISRWNRKRLALRKLASIKKQVAPYERWLQEAATLSSVEYTRLEHNNQLAEVLISVIIQVKGNANCQNLKASITSVQNQAHRHFEAFICFEKPQSPDVAELVAHISDGDRRIICFDAAAGHSQLLTTNEATAIARGDFITFVDHHDLLSNYALAATVLTIVKAPDACLIYSDHDNIDDCGKRSAPHFKTNWNPYLLRAKNYLGNSITIRRSLVLACGRVKVELGGAQNLDLALRCAEMTREEQIIHIPLILYHQRTPSKVTNKQTEEEHSDAENVLAAVKDHLIRTKTNATAELHCGAIRIQYKLPRKPPSVSAIILTKDKPNLLKKCVASIIEKTLYEDIEYIIVDNGSSEPEALKILDQLSKKSNITIIRDESQFNFSALNNKAANIAKGEYLCLLNNDIEVIDGQWLNELISIATQAGIGAVGAKLYYPNGRLQHAGVIVGQCGVAGHPFRMQDRANSHYMSRPHLLQEMSAVTAACMVTPRALYQALGGMEEEHLSVAYNDVDYCLRIRSAKLKVLYSPHAELIHHESISRGFDNTTEKRIRIQKEAMYMRSRWADYMNDDPFYNPNLSLDDDCFSLALPPRLRAADWLGL